MAPHCLARLFQPFFKGHHSLIELRNCFGNSLSMMHPIRPLVLLRSDLLGIAIVLADQKEYIKYQFQFWLFMHYLVSNRRKTANQNHTFHLQPSQAIPNFSYRVANFRQLFSSLERRRIDSLQIMSATFQFLN